MLTLRTQAELADLMSRVEQAGLGCRLPLYRAVAAGRIRLVELYRGSALPKRVLKPTARPLLLVLGDDDGSSSGPADWPQARKVLRAARNVVLHGAGATAEHYAQAVALAEGFRSVLMIETDTAHLPAWQALVQARRPPIPTTTIKVPPDAPAHPTCAVQGNATVQ